MNQNQSYEEEIGRPLFLPLSRTKQFRILLLIVVSTFTFVAALFFGIGYLVATRNPPKETKPVKPSVLAHVLPKLLDDRQPVFIWGPSGAGKSSVVSQIAQATKRSLADVRVSQLDSIDLRGFPMPDTKKKQMEWLPADFLPRKGDAPGVLFLDEMNGGMPAVASACYQLILDRRIGQYELPDNWSIVAAGNNQGDRGITYQMAAPLANRFLHIDYEVDSTDWLMRAADDDIHPHIRAFIKLKTHALHAFDTTANPRCFPTPRAWYGVDRIYKRDYTAGEKFELIKGTVGEGAAGEFTGFVRDIKDMPDIDSIMMDPKRAQLPGSTPVTHAVVMTLSDKTKASNFDRVMDYVERLSREIQVAFVRAATARDKNILSTGRYAKWGLANQDILV